MICNKTNSNLLIQLGFRLPGFISPCQIYWRIFQWITWAPTVWSKTIKICHTMYFFYKIFTDLTQFYFEMSNAILTFHIIKKYLINIYQNLNLKTHNQFKKNLIFKRYTGGLMQNEMSGRTCLKTILSMHCVIINKLNQQYLTMLTMLTKMSDAIFYFTCCSYFSCINTFEIIYFYCYI